MYNNQGMQSLFPQPQGNVYNINSTLEVANVPVGAGISVALCIPENVMYIKTMQNGNPLFYPYKITPLNGENTKTETKTEPAAPSISLEQIVEQLKSYDERILNVEEKLSNSLKKEAPPRKGSDWDL